MIHFDVRTEEQEAVTRIVLEMIEDVRDRTSKEQMIQETREKGYPATLISELMTWAMRGALAEHKDMFLATEKKGLPFKLESLRCLVNAYADAHADRSNLPETLASYAPGRVLLTAMALSTIASEKGGMDRIKRKYLPEILQGHSICYGITEPDAGTNTHKVATTASEQGDRYIVNGQKIFISEADRSRFIALVANVVSEGGGESIGSFIVDMRTPGIRMTPLDIAAVGHTQYSVFFDNVNVPRECLVSGGRSGTEATGRISRGVFQGLNLERIGVALFALYIGKVALTSGVNQVKGKRSCGPHMGRRPQIKQKLARISVRLELANLAIKKAAEAFDQDGDPKVVGLYANMAKLVSSEAAYEATLTALEVVGVEGLNRKDSIGQLVQLARLARIVPINNEMVLNFLGEQMLGLPKSYR